jgi:hypothetical protein
MIHDMLNNVGKCKTKAVVVDSTLYYTSPRGTKELQKTSGVGVRHDAMFLL